VAVSGARPKGSENPLTSTV
jgi:hypothetical protein